MNQKAYAPVLIQLDSGVTIDSRVPATVDVDSMRTLFESGVPVQEIADLFKVERQRVDKMSKEHGWLSARKVESLRKEYAGRQKDHFARTGRTVDPIKVKAEIWEERGERWKEQLATLVDKALTGVPDEVASALIAESKDVKTIMEVARTLTGEQQSEENQPKMAVNISLLRSSSGPRRVGVTMDAETLEALPGSD